MDQERHGDTGGQARPIGEPFDQYGYLGGVTDPRPIPPTKPYPTTTSQYCSIDTPTAEMRNPLQKQHIEMNMAQRGSLLSTLLPNRGMDE